MEDIELCTEVGAAPTPGVDLSVWKKGFRLVVTGHGNELDAPSTFSWFALHAYIKVSINPGKDELQQPEVHVIYSPIIIFILQTSMHS